MLIQNVRYEDISTKYERLKIAQSKPLGMSAFGQEAALEI
tara:strand:+ start:728 stop:847 length:120 start_codon:yes stop_codon:yes gene_type:complete